MPPPRLLHVFLGAALLIGCILYLFGGPRPGSAVRDVAALSRNTIVQEDGYDLKDKGIIVASVKSADTSWVTNRLIDWKPYIYVADDPSAPLRPPQNKGNEASMYLTFIIDHYDRLPATMVFVHHHNIAAHIDNAFEDNADSIRSLRLEHIQRQGYVNLRCMDEPGCICAPMRHWDLREHHYQAAWSTLFPGVRLPDMVQAPCCAQFAVSRAQVRARPKADYQRMLGWLMDTELQTYISGRILEHAWHIVFGRDAVHCPEERKCYCDTYGLCGDAATELTSKGGKRGFWPEDYEWLKDHKCAKAAPGG